MLTTNQCNAIHKTIVEQFKHAIVYGQSVKHQPQRVGLSHELADEDISECSVDPFDRHILTVCSHNHKTMMVPTGQSDEGVQEDSATHPHRVLIAKSTRFRAIGPRLARQKLGLLSYSQNRC